MQLQFHPASGRGMVRSFSIEERGGRLLICVAGILVLVAMSLWVTVPVVAARSVREGEERTLSRDVQVRRAEWDGVTRLARSLADRALDLGDLLNRIAFLYGVSPEQWPKALNPQRDLLRVEAPERTVAALGLYLRGLERSRVLIAEREQADPDLAHRVPAVMPVANSVFEPSAFFGPRTSPWTGEEEFYLGVDLATSEGSPVIASGAGTVAFASTVRRAPASWFWRLGNVVVVSHGKSGATVYGHLARIEVRRGQQVARGDRLGSVGSTGWAISPQLHYEYWRADGESLRPTDPLFAALDRRLVRRPLSVEQMEATSAPGPLDPLPGIQISAGEVAGPAERHGKRPARAQSHRRRI